MRGSLALLVLLRVVRCARPLSRRVALSGGVGGGAAALVPEVAAAALGPSVLALESVAGGLAARYRVDGADFKGVVDTGSPFLLVDGTCGERSVGRWGCYPIGGTRAGRGAQGSLNDESLEMFGGQDTRVEWRRGYVELGRLRLEPAVFGALRSYRARGGAGGVYLGLIKHRRPTIRPTFLEQLQATSLRFDLRDRGRRTLAIATRGRLVGEGDDAVPLVDLRPLGAPVEPYACRVAALRINGVAVALDRPTVAVLDTGTTGLTLSDTLVGSLADDRLAAVKTVDVDVETERGRTVRFSAARRVGAEFPLITTSCALPWFSGGGGRGDGVRRIGRGAGGAASDGEAPHVLFLGLAFLDGARLTIDVEARRLRVG